MVEQERVLTGGDVRAERNRHQPIVTQGELADELGWYRQAITPIENGDVEASQAQLREMLDAVARVVARRHV